MYYCIGYTSNNDWSTSEIPPIGPISREATREGEENGRSCQPVQKEIKRGSASRKGNGLHKERVYRKNNN